MEIIPFLRLSGRRIVVLWVVAGLAGALGAFYAQQLPVRYTGEATVFLERVYPGLRYEREPFVNNYSSAVKFLTPVHERVGGQIGLNAAQVGNGLTIDVPNNSHAVRGWVRKRTTGCWNTLMSQRWVGRWAAWMARVIGAPSTRRSGTTMLSSRCWPAWMLNNVVS